MQNLQEIIDYSSYGTYIEKQIVLCEKTLVVCWFNDANVDTLSGKYVLTDQADDCNSPTQKIKMNLPITAGTKFSYMP